ncbi:hypothetical protein [Paenibacillus medicaginis]|uniref:Uncharacterized protein n=1 Tax=Paenibacillus medicaginis TaxID=1470560 RepID=A0ABV5BUV4_9BACL
MNKNELEEINSYSEGKKLPISAEDLVNKNNRTLLYGYTSERDTWHVYLKDNEIHTIRYKDNSCITMLVDCNSHYVPDKRLYPERCDYEFCLLLKKNRVNLPFTTWTEDVEERDYYGMVL